jgi:hypothetical protein
MPVYNVTGLQVATVYIDASGATSNFWNGSSTTFSSGQNWMGTTYTPA